MLLKILLVTVGVILATEAQRVNVTIFMESQCPFCTKLLREQIWPFHHKYPGVMNLQIVAFGKGDCDYFPNRTLQCHCMHGPHECDLNRLQNCAMSYFPKRYLGLVTCIQGLSSLQEAFIRCLSRLTPRTQRRLIACSTTQAGELLNYYSMVNTHRAGIKIWPTMYVNGRFFDRSYPAEFEICRYTNWC